MLTRTSKTVMAMSLLLAAACGDDGEKSPPTTNKDSGSSFTDEPDASSEQGDDAAVADDGGAADGAVGGDGGTGDNCLATKSEADQNGWAEGCYKCKATSNEQLLNACAKGFRTFDTKQYPSIWSPAKLPDLP